MWHAYTQQHGKRPSQATPAYHESNLGSSPESVQMVVSLLALTYLHVDVAAVDVHL